MQLTYEQILITILIGLNVLQFVLSRNDVSPTAIKNFASVFITMLREQAKKTESTIDDTLLDLADDLLKSDDEDTSKVTATTTQSVEKK
jgi:hypothetical protein